MDGDYVFLVSKEAVWADMLGDVLKDNSIPFITKSRMGAGIVFAVGIIMESTSFFVPSEYLERANEIVESLFSGEACVSGFDE